MDSNPQSHNSSCGGNAMRQGAAQSAPTSLHEWDNCILMLIIVNRIRFSYYSSYYNSYPEFQKRFYWSSSAAKSGPVGWIIKYYPEDATYARATKALEKEMNVYNDDGEFDRDDNPTSYALSDWDYTYDGENGYHGKTPRTGTFLRIRAAYIPPSGVTIE